jgi:hypothetical protein
MLRKEYEVPGYPISTHSLDGNGTLVGFVVQHYASLFNETNKVKVLLATDITDFLDESFSIIKSGHEFSMTEVGQTGCVKWKSSVEIDTECEQNPCIRNMKFTLITDSEEYPSDLYETEYEFTHTAVQPIGDITIVESTELAVGDLVVTATPDVSSGYTVLGNKILIVDESVDGGYTLVGDDINVGQNLAHIGNVLPRKIKLYNPNNTSMLVDIKSKGTSAEDLPLCWFVDHDSLKNSIIVPLDAYETKEMKFYINSNQFLLIDSLHGCELEHSECESTSIGFELQEVR